MLVTIINDEAGRPALSGVSPLAMKTYIEGLASVSMPRGRSWSYASAMGHLLRQAEQLFGQRDRSWTPVGVEIALDRETPQIWFPGGDGYASIVLSKHAIGDPQQGLFQLAHEVVHLLAPSGGKDAPVVEEGLATFFADEISRHCGWAFRTADPRYLAARVAVEALLAIDVSSIRSLRAAKPHFTDWTADFVCEHVPSVKREAAEQLCRPFNAEVSLQP